jgi:hypothetical protein
MVCYILSCIRTGIFCFADDLSEVVPFLVSQEHLQIPRIPEFDATSGIDIVLKILVKTMHCFRPQENTPKTSVFFCSKSIIKR